jgi:hypothetical protein
LILYPAARSSVTNAKGNPGNKKGKSIFLRRGGSNMSYRRDAAKQKPLTSKKIWTLLEASKEGMVELNEEQLEAVTGSVKNATTIAALAEQRQLQNEIRILEGELYG